MHPKAVREGLSLHGCLGYLADGFVAFLSQSIKVEKRVVFKSRWLPFLLVAPQLAITLIFFFLPAGQAMYQSVLQQDAFGTSSVFVGLDNFKTLFADPNYLSSFKVTMLFSVLVAGLGLAISLTLAVCADRVIRGANAYKTFLILPYAVAPAVAGVLWMFIFNPTLGVLSYVMRQMGIEWDYLVNANQALTLIVIAAIWKQVSYNFIFFLAGLQAIPRSLLEAAAMDGAGPFRRFWSVVFPLLSPTTFFLLVMNVVYAFFDTFAIVDATTMGGPGQETNVLVYKVFVDGFRNMDFGGSAAQSVVLMVMVIALTVVQFRFIERRVNY